MNCLERIEFYVMIINRKNESYCKWENLDAIYEKQSCIINDDISLLIVSD